MTAAKTKTPPSFVEVFNRRVLRSILPMDMDGEFVVEKVEWLAPHLGKLKVQSRFCRFHDLDIIAFPDDGTCIRRGGIVRLTKIAVGDCIVYKAT